MSTPEAPAASLPSPPPPPPLPLVVQVGFSGSRLLSPTAREDTAEARAWLAELRRQLQHELAQLPQALGLSPQHFIVGLSQLAAGADLLFTEALQALAWKQRLLLPQSRTEFLDAGGSQGPDFLPHERQRAETLFDAPHVIEQAVVSTDGSRNGRFDETNLHILDESDLLVCLRVQNPAGKVGGTLQLMQRAEARGVPVLELVIADDAQGRPRLGATWHRREKFKCPELPPALSNIVPLPRGSGAGLPAFADYAERLQTHTSAHADRLRRRFSLAAWVIVGTHVVATLLASIALKLPHGEWHALLTAMALFEIGLLGLGLGWHRRLHHRRDTSEWALTRLCAEIGRSSLALDHIPNALKPLLALPFPRSVVPVLRTLIVLHLARDRHASADSFPEVRHHYRWARLVSASTGQIVYYGQQKLGADRWKTRADKAFGSLSTSAIGMVGLEFLLLVAHVGADPECTIFSVSAVLGILAVVLPVLAVAAISLAGAFDLEARAATFHEMHEFLQIQAQHVAQATSLRELAALAAAIEKRLLGETLTWYARRAFTGVA